MMNSGRGALGELEASIRMQQIAAGPAAFVQTSALAQIQRLHMQTSPLAQLEELYRSRRGMRETSIEQWQETLVTLRGRVAGFVEQTSAMNGGIGHLAEVMRSQRKIVSTFGADIAMCRIAHQPGIADLFGSSALVTMLETQGKIGRIAGIGKLKEALDSQRTIFDSLGASLLPISALDSRLQSISGSQRNVLVDAIGALSQLHRIDLAPAAQKIHALFKIRSLQQDLSENSPINLLIQNLSNVLTRPDPDLLAAFGEKFLADFAEQSDTGPDDPVLRLEQLKRLHEYWVFVWTLLGPILTLLSLGLAIAPNAQIGKIEERLSQSDARNAEQAQLISAQLKSIDEMQRKLAASMTKVTDNFRQTYQDACFDRSRAARGNSPPVCYRVLRAVPLRDNPAADAVSISRMHPSEIVRLLDRKGKWIKVRYYDLIAGEIRDGWVPKKYLIDTSRLRSD
jgi:hypothetical protein